MSVTRTVSRARLLVVVACSKTPSSRTEPSVIEQRPAAMSHQLRRKAPFLLIPVFALVAACTSGAGSASPTPGASDAPSPTPGSDAIEHPTGATDIVLRYDEGGGFIMPSFAATMVPPFTLYGDGTIVYRDPTIAVPESNGSIFRSNPMRTAKLTEDQIQDILALALGEGGLAAARPEYTDVGVADAGTATFTINAGGLTKTVSVYALGLDTQGTPDAPARAAFAKLAEALTGIERGGAITATDYAPTAYRGILMEAPGIADPAVIAWPWDDITPADFVNQGDPNALPLPQRTLTPDEVAAIGVDGFEGGLQNITLKTDDGTTYTLSLRPLLPDESE